MVTFERQPGPGVVIEIAYSISGAADLRDTRRSRFEPLEATVHFRDGKPRFVSIRGRRHNERRTWTNGGFGIDADGSIRADHCNEQAPPFVRAVIDDASQHPAVLACAPVESSR